MAEVKMSRELASSPAAMTRMACALMGSGESAKAFMLVKALLAASPEDPERRAAARAILSHGVPGWHRAMLQDGPRNDAFERAIVRAVRPGSRVLDIGTGSGLLAMMAARAGAASVIACDAHAALAATAREIVAANGLSDIVQVLARRSADLDRDRDLEGGADVIVAEVFADNLLEESALATLAHARAELTKPGARIIPSAASVRVAVAWFDAPRRLAPIARVKGFDLSLFDRHVPSSRPVKVTDDRLHLRSDPADLFAFDFQGGGPFPPERKELRLTASDGPANGVVQWIRLQLDDENSYENRPDPATPSHWAAIFHPFGEGRSIEQGDTIRVNASHDTERVQVWFG